MVQLSTLCYLEQDGKYLMLHRTVKKNDVNKDKWIGVGGHFEQDESPDECLLREVKEETGYTLLSYQFRGIVTFVSGDGVTEYMSLYTSDSFTGTPIPCDEGELEWIDKEDVMNLNIWEGDKIFFRLINGDHPFFSLKLVYNGSGILHQAILDGKSMELFDVRNLDGTLTGIIRERGVAHFDGSPHATAHIWVIRPNTESGYDVLLQKRSQFKDSNPNCYDISSAGHVSTGDDYLPSALRELEEELGIHAQPEELRYIGNQNRYLESTFYGRPFRDHELSQVYLYEKPVDIESLHLQHTEVTKVRWMDYMECLHCIKENSMEHCIQLDEFKMLGQHLGILSN